MLSSVRNPAGDIVADFTPVGKQVLDPRIAFLTQTLMQGVIARGTAATVRAHGFLAPAAGKTGTSHDAWFAGYSSNLLCIIWIGNDDYTDVKLQGALAAAPMWADFMQRAIRLPQYSDMHGLHQAGGRDSGSDRQSLQPARRQLLPERLHGGFPRRHGSRRLLFPHGRVHPDHHRADARHHPTAIRPTPISFAKLNVRRDGGIGRRSGLKIRRPQGRGGSTPPPGTKISSTK